MFRRSIALAITICFTLLAGCGQKEPPGFPELVPTQIVVTDGSTPVADITVMLSAVDRSGYSVLVAGKTNGNGVAKLQSTRGDFIKSGAPAGKYRVILKEKLEFEPPVAPEEDAEYVSSNHLDKISEEYNRRMEAARTYSANIGDPSMTPFNVEVASPKFAHTIDLASYKKITSNP